MRILGVVLGLRRLLIGSFYAPFKLMKNALPVGLSLLLLAVSFCVLSIVPHVNKLLDDADAAVGEVRTATVQASKDIHGASQNLNALLIEAGLTANEARLAATEQRHYWNKTAQQTDLTVRALRQLIDRTDRALNDSTLPDVAKQIDGVSASAQISIAAMGKSADALTKQLSDPNIASLAGHLDQSAANVQQATAHLDAASADIEKKVHQMTKPASFAMRVGRAILGVAAQVGAMMGGLK